MRIYEDFLDQTDITQTADRSILTKGDCRLPSADDYKYIVAFSFIPTFLMKKEQVEQEKRRIETYLESSRDIIDYSDVCAFSNDESTANANHVDYYDHREEYTDVSPWLSYNAIAVRFVFAFNGDIRHVKYTLGFISLLYSIALSDAHSKRYELIVAHSQYGKYQDAFYMIQGGEERRNDL